MPTPVAGNVCGGGGRGRDTCSPELRGNWAFPKESGGRLLPVGVEMDWVPGRRKQEKAAPWPVSASQGQRDTVGAEFKRCVSGNQGRWAWCWALQSGGRGPAAQDGSRPEATTAPPGAVLPSRVGAGPPAPRAVLRVPAEEARRGAVGASALLRPEGELGPGRPLTLALGQGPGRGAQSHLDLVSE